MYTRIRVWGPVAACLLLMVACIVLPLVLRRPDCRSEAAIRAIFVAEQETLATLRTRFHAERQLWVVGYDRLAGYASEQDSRFVTFCRRGSDWVTAYEQNRYLGGTLTEALSTFGSTNEEYDHYIALLQRAGSVEVIRMRNSPSAADIIKIVVCRRGIVPSGESWYFLHLPEEIIPEGIEVSSLDAAIEKGQFFLRLEDGWYLCRENW